MNVRYGIGAAAAALAAGYGLVVLGRRATRSELAPLGEADATAIASQMTLREAFVAGARALVGRNAVPYSATATVEINR